jgi:hypothetical protein
MIHSIYWGRDHVDVNKKRTRLIIIYIEVLREHFIIRGGVYCDKFPLLYLPAKTVFRYYEEIEN